LNIASLNMIKDEVLDIKYRCFWCENEDILSNNETVPELEEWNFLNFTSNSMNIKLNFTNPLNISVFNEKDILDIYF